jgi:biotin synthase
MTAGGVRTDCELDAVCAELNRAEILGWLREEDSNRLELLWQRADGVRREHVGDEVHLRGLLEISNHCVRGCTYCGIRAANRDLTRYRMTADEIVASAHRVADFGYGTVVLQAGEDMGLTRAAVADVIARIRAETRLAVTLSLGERPDEDFAAWRRAGADRYLLRFETSDAALFARIHPPVGARPYPPAEEQTHVRIEMLRRLRAMGYEIGSGVMVGLPGQTHESLAGDLELFRALDLDMIGLGPYIPNPVTPMELGACSQAPPESQVPNDELMTCKCLALTRLLCPEANIPSTTALSVLGAASRAHALARGANVIMPNVTPERCRRLYEIYPGKAAVDESADAFHEHIGEVLREIGRVPGRGPGGRRRRGGAWPARDGQRGP